MPQRGPLEVGLGASWIQLAPDVVRGGNLTHHPGLTSRMPCRLVEGGQAPSTSRNGLADAPAPWSCSLAQLLRSNMVVTALVGDCIWITGLPGHPDECDACPHTRSSRREVVYVEVVHMEVVQPLLVCPLTCCVSCRLF
jgi:hypothetical protein